MILNERFELKKYKDYIELRDTQPSMTPKGEPTVTTKSTWHVTIERALEAVFDRVAGEMVDSDDITDSEFTDKVESLTAFLIEKKRDLREFERKLKMVKPE